MSNERNHPVLDAAKVTETKESTKTTNVVEPVVPAVVEKEVEKTTEKETVTEKDVNQVNGGKVELSDREVNI